MKEDEIEFHYPERIRTAFLASGGLTFGDGTQVSAAEIWRYLTEVAPVELSWAFKGPPPDFDFFPGLKRNYVLWTGRDRYWKKIDSGMPLIAVEAGNPPEIYYAAKCMPVHPGFPASWLVHQQELKERIPEDESWKRWAAADDMCTKGMSIECCRLVAAARGMYISGAPVQMIAPIALTDCSDSVYALEASRQTGKNIPSYVIDLPLNADAGPWREEYLAAQLRQLALKLGALSGTRVTDDALAEIIHKQNTIRRLSRSALELWWSAPEPPLNSADRSLLGWSSADEMDYPAIVQLLTDAKREVEQRVAAGQRGFGLVHDPVRLFICGSCAGMDCNMVERAGGVIVGHEESMGCYLFMDTAENGDPFLNLSRALCHLPYELPPAQRAAWTADLVRSSRADGVIFIYRWGCNLQSAIARLQTDLIKEQAGVPTLIFDFSQSTISEQAHTRVEAFIEMLQRTRDGRREKLARTVRS